LQKNLLKSILLLYNESIDYILRRCQILSENKKLYTIGDISNICGVPVKTLRYYDEINLFVPEKRDAETNYRYYTENQLLALQSIRKLKNYGFSLDEIHHILYESNTEKIISSLSEKLNDIHEKISSFQLIYDEISTSISNLKLSHASDEIRVEDIPERNIVYTNRIETSFKNDEIPVCRWFDIFELIRKNRLKPKSSIMATFHNEPLEQFLKSSCQLEICMAVESCPPYPFFKKIPAFTAVTTYHRGSVSSIINTYAKAIKWLNDKGYKISGDITEEYIVSVIDVCNPDDYITKIIIPVE